MKCVDVALDEISDMIGPYMWSKCACTSTCTGNFSSNACPLNKGSLLLYTSARTQVLKLKLKSFPQRGSTLKSSGESVLLHTCSTTAHRTVYDSRTEQLSRTFDKEHR